MSAQWCASGANFLYRLNAITEGTLGCDYNQVSSRSLYKLNAAMRTLQSNILSWYR